MKKILTITILLIIITQTKASMLSTTIDKIVEHNPIFNKFGIFSKNQQSAFKKRLTQALKKTIKKKKKIEPIIFIGGLGATQLEALLLNVQEKPWFFCSSNTEWFPLWFPAESSLLPGLVDCFSSNIAVQFNQKEQKLQNKEGVYVRKQGFVDFFYREVFNYFEAHGYKEGHSLKYGAFDWRFGPQEIEMNEFAEFKTLVEDTYKQNNNTKVHLVGHSFGGNMATYFPATYVSQRWKDKYIASAIPIGGAFDGSLYTLQFLNQGLYLPGMKLPGYLVSALVDLIKTVGTFQWFIPQDKRYLTRNLIELETGQKYTGRLEDIQKFMIDLNIGDTFQKFLVQRRFNKRQPPGVPVHCVYGVGVVTPTGLKFDRIGQGSELLWFSHFEDGDGTCALSDLEICDGWKQQQTQPVSVHRLPGKEHGPMIGDPELLDVILSFTTHD